MDDLDRIFSELDSDPERGWLDGRCAKCAAPKSNRHQAWCPHCHPIILEEMYANLNAEAGCVGPDIYGATLIPPLPSKRFHGNKRGRASFVTGTIEGADEDSTWPDESPADRVMVIDVPEWMRDGFWEEPPPGLQKFLSFSGDPGCVPGNGIAFCLDGEVVALATVLGIQEPGQGKCRTTGEFEDCWNVFWAQETFVDVRGNDAYRDEVEDCQRFIEK